MEILSTTFFLSFAFILAGISLIGFSVSFFDAYQVAVRIQQFVIESSEQTSQRGFRSRERGFTQSLLRRTIVPILNNLVSYLGRYTPASAVEDINRQLSLAGSNLRAQQYYGLRFLFLMMGVGGAIVMFRFAPDARTLLTGGAFILVMFILPILWLRWGVGKRQTEINRSLPDALDMLSVSTAAGLGFDQALLKVSQFYKSAAGDEFGRVVSEMEVGVSRQQALRNFSSRVRISEISSFVAVVIQSEILGMSIADVLHSQAEQMRIQRQYRAKEEAQRLPVKMMIPLALLILPALLAVLLGPTIPAILDIF
jgi:tight adherence protein C